MRIRVAMTEADKSEVVLDTISSVIPIGVALSAVKVIATSKGLSVGEIGAECEGVDSVSGQRLFAAVMPASGASTPSNSTSSTSGMRPRTLSISGRGSSMSGCAKPAARRPRRSEALTG